ncbi:hypothetical protein BZA05DRAFT_440797 [Tricharina praecox]|uniref:uncharacterized protein n=1 Tax=Tricharina praecox TaxID=43433 RepID=UPI00222084BA|nr:uncharacterized protein BZA05DRAFT_440797 [Tricharina praecox]KAI5859213.1 hypothetical protein BZA05DRAFT_440797 [Tricharina praecox]
MYYILYLSSLCRRRRWTDPLYKCISYDNCGYACTVSVNHREYVTENTYETEDLAKEAAAMKAYLICRNLSVSEGQGAVPTHIVGQGVGVWAGRST